MFVRILMRDSARDVNVEIQSSRHREIFEISSRAVQKLWGATLSRSVYFHCHYFPYLVLVFLFKFNCS